MYRTKDDRWICAASIVNDCTQWWRAFLFWMCIVGLCFGFVLLSGLILGVLAATDRGLVWK